MKVYTKKDFNELVLNILDVEKWDIKRVLDQSLEEAGTRFEFLPQLGNSIRDNIELFRGKEQYLEEVEKWRESKARKKFRVVAHFEKISIPKEKTFDDRIDCGASEKEIRTYFNKLVDKKILTEEELRIFLRSNFINCNPVMDRVKLNPKISKGALQHFIYKFLQPYLGNHGNNQIDFTKLLISNFEKFEKDTPEYIQDHWSEPPAKYPF